MEIFWLLHWFEASIQGINEGSNWWQLEAENMVRGGMQTYAEDSHGGLSLLYTSSFLNITELRGTHMLCGRMSALAFKSQLCLHSLQNDFVGWTVLQQVFHLEDP